MPALVAIELTPAQRSELVRELKRGLVELAPESGQPAAIIKALLRAVFFLRQRQAAEGLGAIADQLARLGFVWADQLRRERDWQWVSVSADGSLSPAVVSADLAYVCDPVGLMLHLLERQESRPLEALYAAVLGGRLPPSAPGALLLLSPESSPAAPR